MPPLHSNRNRPNAPSPGEAGSNQTHTLDRSPKSHSADTTTAYATVSEQRSLLQMKTAQKAIPHDHHLTLTSAEAIDGDTLTAMVHVGLDTYVKAKLRLRGFYAPEHHGQTPELATEARARLASALLYRELTFPLRGSKKDRYGRWLITLYIDGKPANPSHILGDHQLTEEAHRTDLLFSKKHAKEVSTPL